MRLHQGAACACAAPVLSVAPPCSGGGGASARGNFFGKWVVFGCAGVPDMPHVDHADQQPVRLLQVCGTTPCMLQGARKIYAAIKERLGIDYGETTQVCDE